MKKKASSKEKSLCVVQIFYIRILLTLFRYKYAKQSSEKLMQEKIVNFTCHHYIGKSIEFQSLDEALEYYMNFHM